MPINKSIYTIEVDDSQFKRFKQLWDQYQEAVGRLPNDWAAVADEATAAGVAHQRLTGSMEDHVRLIVQQEMAAKEVAQNIVVASSGWSSIVQHAKDIDRSLERSIVKLAKWGTLATGVLGGLGALGIGASLFGLDRLAASVTATRRSAMGLGMTYGGYQAAGVNYQRFSASPGSILENAAEAQTNLQSDQYRAMLIAGVSPAEISAGPEQSVPRFLENLPRFLKKGQEQLWGSYSKSLGFDQIMPMSDIRAYMNMSPAEQKQARDKAREDAKNLNVDDKNAKAWADFLSQMDRAGKTLEAHIMTALTPLEPDLENLSKAVVGLVQTLADSGIAKDLVTGLGTAINEFADYINKDGGDSLKKNIKDFVTWIGSAATEIWNFLSGLGIISPAKASEVVPNTPNEPTSEELGGVGGGGGGPGGTISGGSSSPWTGGGGGAPPDVHSTAVTKELDPEKRAMLDLIASGESKGDYKIAYGGAHFDSYSKHPGGGAAGRYQDLPSTWSKLQKKYNLPDFSPKSQDIGNMHLAEDDYRKSTGRDLWADVRAGNWAQIKQGLQGTWDSWKYYSPEKMKAFFERALENEKRSGSIVRPLPEKTDVFPHATPPKGLPSIPGNEHSLTKQPKGLPSIPGNDDLTKQPKGSSDPINPTFFKSWDKGFFREGIFAPSKPSPTPEKQHESNSNLDIYNAPPRLPVVSIRNNTGNNPVLAHAQNAAPTTSVQN